MEPKNLIPTVFLSAALSACTPTIDNRGYETDNVDFTKVQPGVHNTEQVITLLGSPSTVSTFKPQTWYYVSEVTSTTSFFTPKVVDKKTVIVTFDDNGIVEKLTETQGESVREIKPVKRETPTSGYQTGVLREVFSNFGKIASRDKPGPR